MGEAARERVVARGASLRTTLPARTLAGFVAAALAVVVIAVVSYRTLESRAAGARRITHTLDVLSQLDGLYASLRDAESGQRGYLITGDETYLAPYERAVAGLPAQATRLRASIADDEAQSARLEDLLEVARLRIERLAGAITVWRAGQKDEAASRVREGHGRVHMDRARALIDAMQASERGLLDVRTVEWERTIELSTLVTWAGSGLLLFLIGAAAVMSGRDLREQQVQAWLRAGQNELALAVQGEQEVGPLSDAIVGLLARLLGAQVGVVYFAADEQRGLRRTGAYALPAAAGRRPRG